MLGWVPADAAQATLTPSSYNFGPVKIRGTSPSHAFRVSFPNPHVGFKTAGTLGPFVVTGSTCVPFKIPAPPCAVSAALRPGYPLKPGRVAGTFTVVYSDGKATSAHLSGTVVNGVNVKPSSYNFGTVTAGSSSPSKAFTISFPNPAIGTKGAFTHSPFVITGSTCSPFKVPSPPCTDSVAFRPALGSSKGPVTGSLIVVYTDGGADTIPLSGTVG
jgi:hypothetical protein